MNNMYDEYGCCASCGYSWCDILNRCIRIWETECSSHRRMTKMTDFNINELMLFIVGVLGAFGGLCVIIQKSKCSDINLCCFKCKRDVKAIIEEEKIALGRLPTPRKEEPEVEDEELFKNNRV
jgi:hypothetical protein